MGETVEEMQQPVSPTMPVQSDSEESTESTLGIGPGLSGMDLSGDAEGRGGDPKTTERMVTEVETRETTDGEFSCRWGTCTESFSHVDLLASHVTCVHATSGEGGLFFCGWRGCSRGKRGFNARYKMLIHVRTHTNEKPHRCPRCDKSFSRAENLKIHARSHTGERPYVCPVPGCGKAYSNSSDRFKHTRTHSVERPYACRVPGCSKRYTDPSSLRKHVKTYAHYHRPGTEENNNAAPSDSQLDGKASLVEQIQDKKASINIKANEIRNQKSKNSFGEQEVPKIQRASKTEAVKNSKTNPSSQANAARSKGAKDATREEPMETDCSKERLNETRKINTHNSGRVLTKYNKSGSQSSWSAIPDDKWLENDIEEVEEDDEEEANQEFRSGAPVGMKDERFSSERVFLEQAIHPKMLVDGEWSSGGEEGWMSDGSDYLQNGLHKVAGVSQQYMDFLNKAMKSNQRPFYAEEQQLLSKLNKKNYILSKSCQKRLDDLLLRSLPKYSASHLLAATKHLYHTDSYQPMDFSPAAHQSREMYKAVDRYKKVLNDFACHSIPYEQVVPLDLRKISA
ncbi:hypothetical protein J437_LFUL007517 [Ladona fulva]|uniref:C2H2-type domain-containing protein n=1 Tax=Ladona fulva TaxID=123851 RepID=A0A8K0K579_LADFU|nr:hypothetical protein J437_LFUL007517 [Ladona fulva]